MDVLTWIILLALGIALVAHIFILHLEQTIRRLKAQLPHTTLVHSATAIASIHYDKSDGRFWIEMLADIDDISTSELVRLGNFVYGWTQSLWKAKVDNEH